MDNKYTEFIENYLMNDKTKSAIMLIGGWGTGKSYYIQNVLKPYLENKKADCCVVVSLYGLNDLKDISKAIYLETRTKKISEKISRVKILKRAENKESAKVIGKTIVKGVTSFFNVDLSSSEEDLQRLYESIDLTGKLVILEDLERSNIPIKDVLGYVNNLVEQDGVKVLLVANEKEILKSEVVVTGKDKNGVEQKEWQWTTETKEYLKTKEKTISDTIPYVCDYPETIENILKIFKDESIEILLVDKLVDVKELEDRNTTERDKKVKIDRQMLYLEIISFAEKVTMINLRSFIFACQKTVDILSFYNKEIDRTFVKYLFMSIVAFSFKLKENDELCWNDKENGCSLGTSKYPLSQFAHDYIKYQNLDADKIEKAEKAFLAQKKADDVQNDARNSLYILYDFHLTTSELLEGAIAEIKKYLEKINVIDIIIYGKLANYLIIAKALIDTPTLVDDCKEIMKDNLKNGSYDIASVDDGFSFHDSFRFWTHEQEVEYNEFINEMQAIVKNKSNYELDFDYDKKNIDAFVKEILNKRTDYINQRTFIKRMDISKLIELIKQCTSEEIDKLRRVFGTIYSSSNINEYFMEDKPSLIQLKNNIETFLVSKEYNGDKIKTLQLSWFLDNLDNILEKLN